MPLPWKMVCLGPKEEGGGEEEGVVEGGQDMAMPSKVGEGEEWVMEACRRQRHLVMAVGSRGKLRTG